MVVVSETTTRQFEQPRTPKLRACFIPKCSKMDKQKQKVRADLNGAFNDFLDCSENWAVFDGMLYDVLSQLQAFKAAGKDFNKRCMIVVSDGESLLNDETSVQEWKGGEA